jgi:LPXTG-site transpeptidase (sortase) family protein
MRVALGLAVIGALLGVVAAIGWWSGPADTGSAGPIESSLTEPEPTVSPSVPQPSTTFPTPKALWAANESSLLTELAAPPTRRPSRLIIETLGIDAPIGSYGVDSNGQMDVPDNVNEVGWYRHGPSPGEPGSAVLAAHVDLRGPGRGLFFDLDELEVGDDVVVTFDDGGSTAFQVVARSTYLKTELPLDVIFSRQGEPVLTLVTCGGGFSRSARRYDSNVVVYAVPA